ncbi:Os09g0506700 [Oryza sativa Japonica Group]|uniref:Os09g0506700 protein n=2 Tax=Oryza sativa subsp. japonica TaxID=39947 RepID=Q0J0K8_ORYSJ|nr:Os09g0506700 [Oryza sativa Japonica Group]|eukprot:NP_001063609.2 Os09g0506700 [Oryza sativa Japonica Group]
MGLLVLKRLMSVQQERRHIQARMAKRKGSVCLQLANSEGGKIMGYSGLNLPEDIWSHIHSLMPLRDAARAACVSRAFRSFWRYHPNLIFRIETPDLNFIKKVDCILKNHSGIGIKSLRFESGIFYNASTSYYLDSWLQIAVTPLIEELTLGILSYNTNYFDSKYDDEYNFPCSLLSDGRGSSMRHLYLSRCSFHPTINLELRNLTRLHLAFVHITGNELGCVLSNSYALERLELNYCYGIICVKIPCLLQRLSHLEVFECRMLQVIENSAPNLGSFHFGINHVQLLLGESLQMKSLSMCYPGAVYYACAELPSNVPNLETLTIGSPHEMVDTPMLPSKFLHLKCLTISLVGMVTFSPAYDYFSLVSFLDASPSLETFFLDVSQERMGHVSIFGDSLQLRQMPEHHRHGNLQSVKITGFCSAKSLIELTCYILDNTTSLKCLTLDTTRGVSSCSTGEHKKCFPIGKMLTEANRAVLAIETFIERKVPSTVKLAVTKPCSRCHVKS